VNDSCAESGDFVLFIFLKARSSGAVLRMIAPVFWRGAIVHRKYPICGPEASSGSGAQNLARRDRAGPRHGHHVGVL